MDAAGFRLNFDLAKLQNFIKVLITFIEQRQSAAEGQCAGEARLLL